MKQRWAAKLPPLLVPSGQLHRPAAIRGRVVRRVGAVRPRALRTLSRPLHRRQRTGAEADDQRQHNGKRQEPRPFRGGCASSKGHEREPVGGRSRRDRVSLCLDRSALTSPIRGNDTANDYFG
jgi:hypothetical protein